MPEPLLRIPERLAYLLEKDPALEGAVHLAIGHLGPWIKHSHLPFFPDYTDHGPEHIEGVLVTATGLFTDDSLKVLSPADAAVLILAILLHDSAMHLTEDAFVALVSPERHRPCIPKMGDRDWHLVWEDFLGDAARFDGKKLTRLFGNAKPVTPPVMDADEMTLRDRKLIGEFLRIHHPRLAHEIALHGVPSFSDKQLAINGFFVGNEHILQLAGLVARSHGTSVRAYLPYLTENFHRRAYKRVHTIFLMTLIRVADYVQLEAERAPQQMLQVKTLRSPVSAGEWKTHHAIRHITNTDDDPEALFIDAQPEDVFTFTRVREWVEGCQRELDHSWAVIGEVYGRYRECNDLGLNLRRIRSNLDDVAAFGEEAEFIPKPARFQAADAELLKLLITPLYGNKPGVGIRELMQNALDAVRELEQYLKDSPKHPAPERPEQEADVLIAVIAEEGKEASITISDRGIGMTPDAILNYFLTAGASFRRSNDWRKAFEAADGNSKVLRAGRFGVGALAAFLLGPRIEVSTRHVDETHGVAFAASIDDDAFEMRKVERPVGTTIRIPISAGVAEGLREIVTDIASEDGLEKRYHSKEYWDWYVLEQPSVVRTFNGQALKRLRVYPDPDGLPPNHWHHITHKDFSSVMWAYRKPRALVCNGIQIGKISSPSLHRIDARWEANYQLQLPTLSVFDPNGNLPINLQRSGLAEENLPFETKLHESILRDLISFAMAKGPSKAPHSLKMMGELTRISYPGSTRTESDAEGCKDWMFTDAGFSFLDFHTIRALRTDSVLSIIIDDDDKEAVVPASYRGVIIPEPASFGSAYELISLGIPLNNESYPSSRGPSHLSKLKRLGARLLIPSKLLDRLMRQELIPSEWPNLARVEREYPRHYLLSVEDCNQASFDFDDFVQKNTEHLGGDTILCEYCLDHSVAPLDDSPTGRRWTEILGGPLIPFDLEERKRKFAHLEKELEPYMAQWRE